MCSHSMFIHDIVFLLLPIFRSKFFFFIFFVVVSFDFLFVGCYFCKHVHLKALIAMCFCVCVFVFIAHWIWNGIDKKFQPIRTDPIWNIVVGPIAHIGSAYINSHIHHIVSGEYSNLFTTFFIHFMCKSSLLNVICVRVLVYLLLSFFLFFLHV